MFTGAFSQGTWTPQVQFGGAATGLTYTYNEGVYCKMGRMVHCGFSVQMSAVGSSTGSATIINLPFSPAGLIKASTIYVPIVYAGMTLTAGYDVYIGLANSSTTMTIHQGLSTGSLSQLTNSNFTATSFLTFTFKYMTVT